MPDSPRQLELQHVHQPGGWLSPGYLRIGEDGLLESVSAERPEGWSERDTLVLDGFAVPGMPNLHSHSFQRAIAGWTEQRSRDGDSFWSWRSSMYELASRIGPEQLEAITAELYVEMLLSGMTAVGEFHYLHRDPDGRPYADPAELGRRILAAAERTGIALTLLPVLYLHGGFDGAPIEERQQRFAHEDVDDFLTTVDRLREAPASASLGRVGIAPHSLRAVTEPELRDVIRAAEQDAPIHIHIAEQEREVEECTSALGQPPIDWLMDRFDVGRDWCLVHATHASPTELRRLAASDAVVGLCPTTEANLGDGLFPLAEFLGAGGSFGIGSDSQISVSVAEELRLLEYGQRLEHRRRNVCAGPGGEPHVGRRLYDAALAGGARALGMDARSLTPGRRADLVVLDPGDPRLVGHGPETVLDAHVFASVGSPVRDVMVGGTFVVRNGRHFLQDEILERYAAACRQLFR